MTLPDEATNCRYADILERLLEDLGAVSILRIKYEYDYQGYVDVDALLSNGSVFSYEYSYGSCSGCDEWEDRGLSDSEIKSEMLRACTIFDSESDYMAWRGMCKGDK